MAPTDRTAWTKKIGARSGAREPRTRAPKYYAQPVTVDGIRFESSAEARRYQELKLLSATGAILALERQPRFPLQVVQLSALPAVTVHHCGMYTADFRYYDVITGEAVIEDVKSDATRTAAYRLRVKLAEAIHGVTIREV